MGGSHLRRVSMGEIPSLPTTMFKSLKVGGGCGFVWVCVLVVFLIRSVFRGSLYGYMYMKDIVCVYCVFVAL